MSRQMFLFPVFLFLLGLVDISYGADIKFSPRERRLMDIAYIEGMNINKPEIMQIILLNESVAGRYGPVGDEHFKNWRYRSYGVMQVRFVTAKYILRKHYGQILMDDKVLLHHLTHNDSFNIHVARLYYQLMFERFKNWRKALLAYNVGPSNVKIKGLSYDPNNYLSKADDYLATVIYKHNLPRKRQEMLKNMIIKDVQKFSKMTTYGDAVVYKNHTPLQPYVSIVPITVITNPYFRE